jgi:RNA polymerase sigma factor (sigma-70 family)
MTEAEYLPLVRLMARLVAKRTNGMRREDFEDLVGVGCVALLEAVPRYDPARGASLKTFLSHRVSGAMLDHFRECDLLSRTQRRAVRAGAPAPLVRVRESEARGVNASPLDLALVVDGRALLGQLHGRERRVVIASFWEGRTLKDIGCEWGVGESRVSHVRSRALRRLRAAASRQNKRSRVCDDSSQRLLLRRAS